MIHWFTCPCYLPVMGFDSNSSSSNDNRNGVREKERPYSREHILSIARKAESLGYDSLSVNDHIAFRPVGWTHYVHYQQLPQ
jgi:alkanesulfonate monooxygenase SsuD/methylene tetrahydromethanopterin reductase-like flavin-dependent oxidoreductase (luciferase family)